MIPAPQTPMDKLTIVQHNVQHWNTRKNQLSNSYKEINPDIILLNSHGTKNDETIKITNYITYKINTTNERNDGSAILIKEGIHHALIDDFITDVLCIKVQTSLGWILIATTYLPPRRPYLPFPDFHRLLCNTNPTYIIGDLNAKHRLLGDRKENAVGRGLKRFHDSKKLLHLGPTFPTFISQNSATTPDIILSNNRTYHNTRVDIGPLTTSDHIPIILTITARAITEPRTERLMLHRANWDKFRDIVNNKIQEVEEIDMEESIESVDRMLNKWLSAVKQGMEQTIPKERSRTIVRAITNNKIKDIQEEFKSLKNHSQRYGWSIQTYTRYRELKQRLMEESRNCFIKNWENQIKHLTANYKNPTIFWKKLKILKGTKAPITTYILDSQNNKIYDNTKKEKIFRNIWKNVFKISDEENADFDITNEDRVLDYLAENWQRTTPEPSINFNIFNESNIVERKITETELKDIIKRTKNTAPGFSKINKKIMEELPENGLTFLVKAFNSALSMGYFPDAFKIGILHLIPKEKKSPYNPTNYRPITLLEVPGKMFERTINYRLKHHLVANNLLPPSQHGFREGRGTTTALTVITERIAHTLSRKRQCHLVLRDVSKAFDKVWHNGLKYKILQLGLPPHLEKIICDYITERTVKIRINNIIGPEIEILSGVPQGGILSPTLYTIYTRDLPEPTIDSYDILYADDITQIITHNGKSKRAMAIKVGREIERINKFEREWKIKTNQNKFALIPLASKRYEDIIAEGELLETKTEGKALGLKITTNGYFKHIKELVNKGERAIHDLRQLRDIPENIKLHLVKAYVLPTIEYPTIPICGMSRTQIMKIQRIQNKALRFATNDRFPFQQTVAALHEKTKTKPINIKLYERADKIWKRLILTNDPITEEENIVQRGHHWFPSSRFILTGEHPEPQFT